MMKKLIAALMVLTLSQSAMAWEYKKLKDEMTDAEEHYLLEAEDALSFVIFCTDNRMRIGVSGSEALDFSTESIDFRFDDEPVETVPVRIAKETALIRSDKYLSQLIQKMKAHNEVKVKVRFWLDGSHVETFILAGFTKAFSQMEGKCGVHGR